MRNRSKRIREKCPSGGIGLCSTNRHTAVALGPVAQAAEAEFRPPAEPARNRRKADLERAARALLCADVIDQDDFAARADHARKFVERRFRIGHRGYDELRHHHIEGLVGQRHAFGIHHRQCFDICEVLLGNALMRLAQHRLRQIDAYQPVLARIIGQRNPGADADFEDAAAGRAAGLLGRCDSRAPAGIEHRAEDQVIDRRPARISALDARFVDICPHAANLTAHRGRCHLQFAVRAGSPPSRPQT